jgi:hypothetical protein
MTTHRDAWLMDPGEGVTLVPRLAAPPQPQFSEKLEAGFALRSFKERGGWAASQS